MKKCWFNLAWCGFFFLWSVFWGVTCALQLPQHPATEPFLVALNVGAAGFQLYFLRYWIRRLQPYRRERKMRRKNRLPKDFELPPDWDHP